MLKTIWAEDRRTRWAWAMGLYLCTSLVFLVCFQSEYLSTHTPFNHFALLARSWLDGRLDLGAAPPAYAGHNDFAHYGGRWFIVFPPFPAVVLLPWVAWFGAPERLSDGAVFLGLAGLAPAVLFLSLEKLRRTGRLASTRLTNGVLSLLQAFGTVYFFTAEQGTVWFAAHVVGAVLAAIYLRCSIGAEWPLLSGIALGFAYLTRSPLLFAFPLFVLEAARASSKGPASDHGALSDPDAGERRPEFRWWTFRGGWAEVDRQQFLRRCAYFAVPVAASLGFAAWHNWARFGDPREYGYRYLEVAWQARMEKWGLFHYHYLAKNLGVVLTSLPWWTPPGSAAPFQINAHGLALWITSPFYLWLLRPRQGSALLGALWLTVALVAGPTLFYQNTGWVQFGYRFSNDYVVFLIVILALGTPRPNRLFWVAGGVAIVVNVFGAITFGRGQFSRFYFVDPSQRVFYQPD